MPDVSRRTFVQGMVGTGVGATVPVSQGRAAAAPNQTGEIPEVRLHWLEGEPSPIGTGSTWGVPWPRGTVDSDQTFALQTAAGDAAPAQTWPIAFWPDGSVKWTAHALAADAPAADEYVLTAGTPDEPANTVTVRENGGRIVVETGVTTTTIVTSGSTLIQSIVRDGREIAQNVKLVNLRQRKIEDEHEANVNRHQLVSKISDAAVEQNGPVRAVVRIEGVHSGQGRDWLPFTVRLYFYAGAEHVRMMHTFVFDSDGEDEFVAGLGVRLRVPMTDELYDRHIRFVGRGHGMFAEAIKGVTGLRRDPGEEVREAQIAGKALPDPSSWDPDVGERLHWIPAWGDFRLSQLSSQGFTLTKRTTAGHSWIDVDQGDRASGFGYVGGASGGVGPPQIVNEVEHLVDAQVFGGLFAPVDRSTPTRERIEDNLDFLFDFYAKQQDQRHPTSAPAI